MMVLWLAAAAALWFVYGRWRSGQIPPVRIRSNRLASKLLTKLSQHVQVAAGWVGLVAAAVLMMLVVMVIASTSPATGDLEACSSNVCIWKLLVTSTRGVRLSPPLLGPKLLLERLLLL